MVTDFAEDARCKNCKFFDGEVCKQREKGLGVFEKTSPEDHCGFFDKIDEKKLALDLYCKIVNIFKYYVDMPESNYKIVALWIMGTYIYKSFPTYPYLYFNAMRGSGKTRTGKLIKALTWQGDMLASLSEAVLFRTTGTLVIDEFENIGSKDKNALRELLNTAYKQGGKVKRMKEKKMKDEEGNICKQQVVEEFDTFRPIVMCNIWGIEEVIGDRCITTILEKSNNPIITRLVENFENNEKIKEIIDCANFWCRLCRVVTVGGTIYDTWNEYIRTTHNNTTTLHPPNNIKQHYEFFRNLDESNINGRNLELYLPLLLIAEEVGNLNEIIEIANQKISEKKEEDIMESKDVLLYSYVSTKCDNSWIKIKEMTNLFRNYIGDEQTEEQWLNTKWMGRALKRLNLIKNKRRLGEGREVVIDVEKAKEKMRIFQ